MPIVTTYYKSLFGTRRQVRERYIVDENGVKNGLYQSYHKNGQPAETCTFMNDVRNGSCVLRHENGRISSECTYRDGCREGRYISYYADGTVHQMYAFKRDQYDGECRLFNADGSLSSVYHYVEGVKDGVCEVRYRDEVERQYYKNDILIQQEYWSSSCSTKTAQKLEGSYLLSQTNYTFDAEHRLVESVTLQANKETASHVTYYENGSSREEFETLNGRREGQYKRFSERKHVLLEECSYKFGKIEGKRILYFPETTVVCEESEYKAGKQNGTCVRYDELGKIVERCQYRHGQKVVYPEMVESLFVKQADKEARDTIADQLIALRQQGKATDAIVLAKRFHTEKGHVPRRTAIKMDGQRYRS